MNRGYALYIFTAQNRAAHRAGHAGIGCTVPDDLDAVLEDTHSTHEEFLRNYREYAALVAQPVRESPVCGKCGAVAPVFYGIPQRVQGAMLIQGATLVECGHCTAVIEYRPS